MLSILLQLAVVFSAHAESCGFSQTIHGPMQFRQVEMISRVHSIGLWRGGDLVLNPWIRVGEKAYLGLDSAGHVLQVIELKDRTVAFLLSGDRKVKDLFFHPPGTLLAIDDQGQLLAYEQQVWKRSNSREILSRSLINYGVSMCTAGTGLWIYSMLANASFMSPEIVAAMGVSSVGSLMIEAFRASVKFEKQNEITDGFKPIGSEVKNFRRSQFVRDEKGEIVDFELGEGYSLRALIGPRVFNRWGSFDWTCEHELLPRGIPPETYEPKL